MVLASSCGQAAVHARLGQRVDEARDIGRPRAGDRRRLRRDCFRCSSTRRSRASRTAATPRHEARPESLRCKARRRRGGPQPEGSAAHGRSLRHSESACAAWRPRRRPGSKRRCSATSGCGASFGTTSSSCCGLKPRTTSVGDGPPRRSWSPSFRPSTGRPLGRITTASLRSAPPERQPSTMAPDILPQPTNQIGLSASLSLPVRIDERRGDGFARRFPAPEHELEDGIEALAFFERRFDDGFRLVERQAVILARVEDGRMSEDDQAGSGPHLEMAEPQLLVDQSQGFHRSRNASRAST